MIRLINLSKRYKSLRAVDGIGAGRTAFWDGHDVLSLMMGLARREISTHNVSPRGEGGISSGSVAFLSLLEPRIGACPDDEAFLD